MNRLRLFLAWLAIRAGERVAWVLATAEARAVKDDWGVYPGAWIFDPFWRGRSPGCEACMVRHGPEAACWGVVGCHGYFEGCACPECVKRSNEESLQLFGRRFED